MTAVRALTAIASCDYDSSGNELGDHSLGMPTGGSEVISGVLADGSFLYLIAWPGTNGTNGAHIIKISTQSWQIINQWGINQAHDQRHLGLL